MPQVSAAVLRSTPSSTSASESIRRAAALFFSPLAALRSSEAVRSSRVIDTAAPIDAAPLKSQHRVRVSLIWESLMSHSFGPLVLEGSVRKSANRLRITGQLLDAASGAHLWADRFDGEVGDIFDLQDKVAESVVGAIAPAVERARASQTQ